MSYQPYPHGQPWAGPPGGVGGPPSMPPNMGPGGPRGPANGTLLAVAVGFGVVVVGGGAVLVALRLRSGRAEPTAVAPSVAPTVVARPALRTCVVDQGPVPVGAHGSPDVRMRLAAAGSELAVGWRVPRSQRNGTDDGAVVRLDRQGRVVGWLDPEQRSVDRYPEWSPLSVRRVQPYAGGDGSLRYLTNRVERTAVDETIRCGDFASNWGVSRVGPQENDFNEGFEAEPSIVGGPGMLRPDDMERPFFCSAVGDRAPIVIGVRGRVRRRGGLDDDAAAFAVVGGQRPVVIGEYPMRAAYRAMARSTNPLATLREAVSESVDAVEVPGRGYAVLMRQSQSFLLFWLSADLHPVAPTQTVLTNNRESKADLVRGPDGLLLLYADRESADRSAPYRVVAQRLVFGQAPGPRVFLRTSDAPAGEEIAPSASALAGGWVVSWTQRVGRTAAEQNVFVRTFTDTLEPEGPARQVGVGLSDSRVHAFDDRFVLVAFAGRRDDMPIVSHAGACQR